MKTLYHISSNPMTSQNGRVVARIKEPLITKPQIPWSHDQKKIRDKLKRYVSISSRPMVTKLCKVVLHCRRTQPQSHMTLWLNGHVRLSNKWKMLDLPSQDLWSLKLSGGDFWWGAAIHKITWLFVYAKSSSNLQSHVTLVSQIYERSCDKWKMIQFTTVRPITTKYDRLVTFNAKLLPKDI